MDADKVFAVTAWPLPRTIKALRGFLGLTGYYRKFVHGYGLIAAPLTTLLKRDAFRWTTEATTTFQALKLAITSTPVLQLPNFAERFIVDR